VKEQESLEQIHTDDQWISTSQNVLMEVLDPCSCLAGSPMSITDLGLVQSVSIHPSPDATEPPTLSVRLTLTDPMCMYFIDMAEEIRQTITQAGWPGLVSVEWDTSVDWSSSMMSPAGQLKIIEVKQQLFGQLLPYDFQEQQDNTPEHCHGS
jgi:metal-sulfur cluster biosynthetic enzyme